jgi:hypothetical protein
MYLRNSLNQFLDFYHGTNMGAGSFTHQGYGLLAGM